jgi:RHS repeat-associated protein
MYESSFGLTKDTYPDSEFELYTYDDAGNVVAFTDCMGNTTSYTYDDIYRISQITYADQSVVSYSYDLNSNRIRMDDDAPGTGDYVTYTYDQWNRLVTETRHISQESYAVSYEYDVSNNVTEITYPDSMEIVYEYDDLNRMREIKRYVDGQNDEILFSNPQYDVESLMTQFEYGNGLQAFYTFDSRDRFLTIDVKDGSTPYLDLDYTYDNNSNITQISDQYRNTSGSLSLAQTREYVYDGLDRLTEEKKMGIPVHSYTYDKAGNRTGKDSLTYTVNVVNEVTALSDGTSFTYDDNGNRIQKSNGTDTWDYTYDYANRLTKVEKNQATIGDYVYDGNGKRLQKTENDVTTTYICSGINVMYEENATGYISYVYGPAGLLAKRTTIDQESNTYYYHKDHLGSTRSVTDSNKAVISTSTYHPFGDADNEEGSEQYLYTGKERDSTGLYYYGARYYDPEIGRFVTRDTLKRNPNNPRSVNRYTYCQNNPLIYFDPDGKLEKKFTMLGSGYYNTPTNFQYSFMYFGHLATVDTYILKSDDNSDFSVAILITYVLQKTIYKPEGVEEAAEFLVQKPVMSGVANFSIKMEDIENTIVEFLTSEDTKLINEIGDITEDQIHIHWQISECEAGNTIYVYVYYTVSTSGETEVQVIISYYPLNPYVPLDTQITDVPIAEEENDGGNPAEII